MRILRVGRISFRVMPEVEAQWPDVVERSRAFAGERGDDRPYVHFGTDDGASGSLALVPEAPVSFADVDDRTDTAAYPFLGTLVSLLPGDPRTIGREVQARTSASTDDDIEGMPEDDRLRVLASLSESAPHVDHERLAGGVLAGRATPDRPDVPPWEYERYAEEQPGVTLAELVAVRFPEVYAEGRGSTVTSIAEHVDGGRPDAPHATVAEEIGRWRFLHEAGVVRWDSARRAVEQTVDLGEMYVAQHAWAMQFRGRRSDGVG